jgi:ATP-binding cassette, subfamily B, multidrug efflux pump
VIQQGNIAESGTHAKLVAQGGVYANLYALQMNTANQIEISENI